MPAWLTVLFAGVAGAIALRNLRVDRLDRKREQAGKVAAWWGRRTERRTVHRNDGTQYSYEMQERVAVLRNASELPVYDVQVRFQDDAGTMKSEAIGVLPPNDDRAFVHPPPDRIVHHRTGQLQSINYDEGTDYVISLRFRDANNRVWLRSAEGHLQELNKRAQERDDRKLAERCQLPEHIEFQDDERAPQDQSGGLQGD